MIIVKGSRKILEKRKKQAEEIFKDLPYRYCFITGSFLFKKKYRDIDVFVITRSKKEVKLKNKKIKITKIDFNDLYSLFYHSISKYCLAKNILPEKPLKVTMADYWGIINEAIPAVFNQKNDFKKEIRFLILYTEYFESHKILDTYELAMKINSFKTYKEVLNYVNKRVLKTIKQRLHKSYIKRFFYTSAGLYRDVLDYPSTKFLYNLSHEVINRK